MLEVVTVIEQKHDERCFIYDNGPCDCGVEKYATDEEIDAELFDKEMAKD
jgi:hypothetical protein